MSAYELYILLNTGACACACMHTMTRSPQHTQEHHTRVWETMKWIFFGFTHTLWHVPIQHYNMDRYYDRV